MATAASILGKTTAGTRKNAAVKIKAEWQIFYNRLLELREQLLRQMNGLAKESAQEMAGYSLHMADSGTDNFDRDFCELDCIRHFPAIIRCGNPICAKIHRVKDGLCRAILPEEV